MDDKDKYQQLLEIIVEKLNGISVEENWIQFDPFEADMVGAFKEDALTDDEAFESMPDLSWYYIQQEDER